MLPPGHIAAGFLTAKALLNFVHPALTSQQHNHLLWWGMFFGFAPDIDMFYVFFRQRSMLVSGNEKISHRKFISHAPILWLIAGLLIYFFSSSAYVKFIGLLLWLGSWSHFLLDSIYYGVMWLWPFSSKIYALKDREVRWTIYERSFFKHNWKFFILYTKKPLFYLEILIIIVAIVISTKY